MDMSFHEEWLLDQHKAMVRSAEELSRLEGWQPRDRLSVRVAMRLRRLADRIEGDPTEPGFSPARASGSE